MKIASSYTDKARIVLFRGDCLDLLRKMPDGCIDLVVTSPPYNLGKPYEKKMKLERYIEQQAKVIDQCVRVLSDTGSLCWQVGNFVDKGRIVPLDSALFPVFDGLKLSMRNRIIWQFGHGLHATKRFSGRYETICWYTKSDRYTFNLDAVRVPQKYPNKKHFKGPQKGRLSGHPSGKNPGDVWQIPNVKANHVEKTEHPCQFPVELVERLVLAFTDPGQTVLDPFSGVGSSLIAAAIHGRKAVGAEITPEYADVAENRLLQAEKGVLKIRPMERPVYDPENPTEALPPKAVKLSH